MLAANVMTVGDAKVEPTAGPHDASDAGSTGACAPGEAGGVTIVHVPFGVVAEAHVAIDTTPMTEEASPPYVPTVPGASTGCHWMSGCDGTNESKAAAVIQGGCSDGSAIAPGAVGAASRTASTIVEGNESGDWLPSTWTRSAKPS
jgi:hypothetical protein